MPETPAAQPVHRTVKFIIVGVMLALMVLGLVLGTVPTKIVVSIICLATLQGLWRGAGEIIGLVISTIVGVVLAPPVGRAMEGVFSGVTGSHGVLNRTISIGAVGLVVIIVGTAVISVVAKRFLKRRPQLAAWNSLAGAGLGLVEGTILGLSVLWAVLALEPVAASQVAGDVTPSYMKPDKDTQTAGPLAKGLVGFAADVRESALGGLAQTTNPFGGSRLITLSNDFAMIVKDEAAYEYFINTPVMKEIDEMRSVNAAVERVKADTELTGLFKDQEISGNTIRAVLESRTILDILDHTTVVSDLSPKMDALIQAVADAKAKIGTGAPRPMPVKRK